MADTRVLRWRAQLSIAAAIVVALAWCYTGGPSYVIRIDHEWIRPLGDTVQVLIDGEVVGTLVYDPRAAPVRGFEVEPGTHVVELRSDRCEGRPRSVTMEGSRIAVLLADFEERPGSCTLFLR